MILEGNLLATGRRVAIAVARFNALVTDQLLAGAIDALVRHGADRGAIDCVRCAGAFELPAVARRLALSGRYDGVVALAAVIRGGTPHFEFVSAEVTKGLGQLSLEARCAVSMGVLTCDTMEQALERAGLKAGNAGAAAAAALIEQMSLFEVIDGACALASPGDGDAAGRSMNSTRPGDGPRREGTS